MRTARKNIADPHVARREREPRQCAARSGRWAGAWHHELPVARPWSMVVGSPQPWIVHHRAQEAHGHRGLPTWRSCINDGLRTEGRSAGNPTFTGCKTALLGINRDFAPPANNPHDAVPTRRLVPAVPPAAQRRQIERGQGRRTGRAGSGAHRAIDHPRRNGPRRRSATWARRPRKRRAVRSRPDWRCSSQGGVSLSHGALDRLSTLRVGRGDGLKGVVTLPDRLIARQTLRRRGGRLRSRRRT